MKSVLIKLHKKQIVNDVSSLCAVMARELQRNPETEEQGGDIMNPDDELTKPLVARAITEGFGEVKRVCQRYLIMGRDTDDNRLERINEMTKETETINSGGTGTYSLLFGETYLLKVSEPCTLTTSTGVAIGNVEKDGVIEYTPSSTTRIKVETSAESLELTYFMGNFGTLELELGMPFAYNLGMTETAKNSAHRMIVDYVMQSLLQDQWPEKAAVYAEKFKADVSGLRNAINARTTFGRSAADWS